jgi:hypothetical protein
MSFKQYLSETNAMELLDKVNKVQTDFSDTFESLQNLSVMAKDEKYSRLLNNINLANIFDKIELKFMELGKLLADMQNVITSGGAISNQYGSWGGPE